ncbi:MAG: hypothetical protein IKT98_04695 [Selenomonadaceae bacterium]|nr:hypothetical protein [Selenomonadaceae bacterium]
MKNISSKISVIAWTETQLCDYFSRIINESEILPPSKSRTLYRRDEEKCQNENSNERRDITTYYGMGGGYSI